MKKRVKQAADLSPFDFDDSYRKEVTPYVEKSIAVAKYISNSIKALDCKQKDLAYKLGKSEAEISKWISGDHNLTLKSIIKLESVLPIHILNPEITGLVSTSLPSRAYFNMPSDVITAMPDDYIGKYGEMVGSYVAVIGGLSIKNNTTTTSVSGKVRA